MAKRPDVAPMHHKATASGNEAMHGLDAETRLLLLTEAFQQSPSFLAVLLGPTHVFQMANGAYYQLVGHRELIGESLLEVFPEIEHQGFVELIDRVLRTGVPFKGKAMPVTISRTPGGALETLYIDLSYQPIMGNGGVPIGVLAHGNDVFAL